MDDLISRQAVLDILQELWGTSGELMDAIMELPSAEPKTGHWIEQFERHFLDTRTNINVEMKDATGKGYHAYINVQCSECCMVTIHDSSIAYQYCPHCGARMEDN